MTDDMIDQLIATDNLTGKTDFVVENGIKKELTSAKLGNGKHFIFIPMNDRS